ncbi:Endo-1,4-beta-glucanase [Chitinispirillum alkaliphilum]|nr:Endo-1,4-beta-glucanase [Chitinispirillum alkaliphilum]
MFLRTFIFTLMVTAVYTLSAASDPFVQNQKLGRGINLGNIFEAPGEGQWGISFHDHYLDSISQKGFQSIRVPIRWSAPQRTQLSEPYTISEDFFSRIDHVIERAFDTGLSVIINVHHYEELFEDATGFHRDRFVAIWEQISKHYSQYGDSLYFEVLNEPHDDLTPQRWNLLFSEVLQIIREKNPTRTVLLGTAEWGGIEGLSSLEIPEDPNLILTVHYYSPFQFTHQGASWVENTDRFLGTTWSGTYIQKNEILNHIETIHAFGEKHNIPVNIGEFGAYSRADIESRHLWTKYCARLFERYGFSWHYWEFGSGFGAYDPSREEWIDTLVNALISSDTSILNIEEDVVDGVDLVTNGDFSSGMRPWVFGVWDQSGSASSKIQDEELVITVTKKPQATWQIQLTQGEIDLEKNSEYIVLFDARSSAPVSISASVGMSEEPYTNFASTEGVMLSDRMSTFGFQFTATEDHSGARLAFNLGTEPADITFDNIRLIKITNSSSIRSSTRSANYAFNNNVSYKLSRDLQIFFHDSDRQKTTVSLFDAQGRIFGTKIYDPFSGANSITFPRPFSRGPLFARFSNEAGSYVKRIIHVK